MRYGFYIFILVLLFGVNPAFAQKQKTVRTINVNTEPDAKVWIDDILRGTTDESGKLVIKPVAAGVRKLRVRANGFKEFSQNLTAAQKGDIKITLVKTTDEAELAFQQAESETDKAKAIALYEKAIKLRPKYAESYLGLARALESRGNFEGALAAIKNARKARPVYPEASAVEGRIYKDADDEEKAIASFNRAIKEGKGFQPEAHTGLALLYKEKAYGVGNSGDLQDESALYAQAAVHFQKAIEQLSASEPIVYLLLGEIYETQKKYSEAIQVYERFLRDFPDSNERTAVESFIVQIKKQLQP